MYTQKKYENKLEIKENFIKNVHCKTNHKVYKKSTESHHKRCKPLKSNRSHNGQHYRLG